MIYLIGGAPRVGKSVLAKRVADALRIPCISTDVLCSKTTKAFSVEEKNARFPLPPFSGTASENTLTPEARVELQLLSAKSLEPEMEALIAEALSQQEPLVIEGVHLLPEYVRSLLTQQTATSIRTLFIGQTDMNAVVEGIQKNTNTDNWMRESDLAVIRQVAAFVAAFSAHIHQEASILDLPYHERTTDFEGDMKRFADFFVNFPPPHTLL